MIMQCRSAMRGGRTTGDGSSCRPAAPNSSGSNRRPCALVAGTGLRPVSGAGRSAAGHWAGAGRLIATSGRCPGSVPSDRRGPDREPPSSPVPTPRRTGRDRPTRRRAPSSGAPPASRSAGCSVRWLCDGCAVRGIRCRAEGARCSWRGAWKRDASTGAGASPTTGDRPNDARRAYRSRADPASGPGRVGAPAPRGLPVRTPAAHRGRCGPRRPGSPAKRASRANRGSSGRSRG